MTDIQSLPCDRAWTPCRRRSFRSSASSIRQTPGTISLGQGVVALRTAAGGRSTPCRDVADRRSAHDYQDGAGLPALVDAARGEAARGERHRSSRAAAASWSPPARNMAFMHAVLAITEPGDEIILPAPFYFNHEMAIQMAGCRAVAVPTDARYQLRLDAHRAPRSRRARAPSSRSRRTTRAARSIREASLREVNALCARARPLSHRRRGLRVLHLRRRAARLAGSLPGAAAPHDLAVLAVEGLRLRRLAHRLHGVPGDLAGAMAKIQDTILICPPHVSQAAAVAALAVGRAYCAPHVTRLADVRGRVLRPPRRRSANLCEVPRPTARSTACARIGTSMDAMTLGRAADSRASRGDRAGHDVRHA